MNRVFLIGRITKDLELKATPQGKSVCQFTLAVNRKHKNENGETEADFINCIVWDKQAENLVRYQKKGNQIAIEGTIRTRVYVNDKQEKKYITEVLVNSLEYLEPKKEEKKDPYKEFGDKIEIVSEQQEMDFNESDLPF